MVCRLRFDCCQGFLAHYFFLPKTKFHSMFVGCFTDAQCPVDHISLFVSILFPRGPENRVDREKQGKKEILHAPPRSNSAWNGRRRELLCMTSQKMAGKGKLPWMPAYNLRILSTGM
jgi:hypothetical protein